MAAAIAALETRLGTLSLRIPKLRQGSYFPPFLEPRKTAEEAEKALVSVIQEAWVGGVTTRWRHNGAILAIGGFTLVGDPAADGGQGCVHRVSAVSRAAVATARRETSRGCHGAS